MVKKRKTIPVSEVLEMSNKFLALDNIPDEKKVGITTLIESILMKTGNYRGFNYLDWLESGFEQWKKDGSPKDTTKYLGREYRRVYHGTN